MLGRLATLLWNGTIATLISGSILPAGAEEAAVSKDNTTSPQLIGYLIDLRRTADIDRENYLQIVMENFRSLAGKDRVFDRSDVDLPIAASRASYRAAIVERIMSNDLNADGEVTEEELRRVNTVFPSKVSRDIDGLVRGYLKVDRNGDGSIDTEEAYSFASERELPDSAPSQRLAAKKLQLIALDCDGDGRLEADEVDASARATFAHYDLDGDGRLVEAEVVLWRGLLQANGDRPKCIFPKLTKDDRVVVFHDADAWRMCSSPLMIGKSTHAELSRLHVGDGPIPTLESLLELVDGRVPLLLEVKVENDIWRWMPAFRRALKDYRGPYGIMSFDPRVPRLLKTNLPEVRRGLVIRERLPAVKRRVALWLADPHFIAVERTALTSAWIARARRRMPAYSWTIKDPEQRAQAEVHADALIWEGDGRPRN